MIESANEPHVLLLGAGYTLQRLASRVGAESCLLSSRSEITANDFREQGFQACVADLSDEQSVKKLFEQHPSVSVVVDSVPPLRGDLSEGKALAANPIRGVENLLEQAEFNGIHRIVYLSATSVYGAINGDWVDEQSKCMPRSKSGEARLASEERYRSGSIPSVSLRIVGIYGPGRGIGVGLRSGRYEMLGDGKRYTNRVHVDDLVEAIYQVLQIEDDSTLPEIICIADDEPTPQREVVEHYCGKFGLPYPSSISEQEAEQAGRMRLFSNQRVSNSLMKEFLGVELKYPSYREGAGAEFEESD